VAVCIREREVGVRTIAALTFIAHVVAVNDTVAPAAQDALLVALTLAVNEARFSTDYI